MSFALLRSMREAIVEQVDPAVIAKIDALPRGNLNEFGVDPFGFDPEVIKLMAPVCLWLHRHYFRVEAHGVENIPGDGRFLLIGNHSGQLPFDAAMVATTVLLEAPKPRLVRGMVERWSAELPFISELFTRGGQVVGDPETCRRLLEADEGVLVFPEGARGISKMFAQRYQLTPFGHGFMRLALQTRAPIVPVAVIGAEEQAPAVADIKPLAKLLGMPALPVIFPHLLPLPLPVKYRIWFGEPMWFEGERDSGDDEGGDEDDDVVAAHVKKVRNTIARMIEHGLERRKGIFL
jgi:1-acyl-sn-glycerol-3-phosphate acyltransferase